MCVKVYKPKEPKDKLPYVENVLEKVRARVFGGGASSSSSLELWPLSCSAKGGKCSPIQSQIPLPTSVGVVLVCRVYTGEGTGQIARTEASVVLYKQQ